MLWEVASGRAGEIPAQGLNGRVILQKVAFYLCLFVPNIGRSGAGDGVPDLRPFPCITCPDHTSQTICIPVHRTAREAEA